MTTSYTAVFGGAVIWPSPTNYQSLTIPTGGTLVLTWPTDNYPASSTIVGRINNVLPGGPGCSLQMPSALNVSVGEVGIFFNLGADALTVLDGAGGTIVSIGAGIAYYLYITDNTTIAGTWGTVQFGAGTSSASAAALAGPGLAASGAVLQQIMAVSGISSNYAAGAGDRDKFLNWTGGGGGTLTLPTAASVASNYYIQFRNSGTGAVTVATQAPDLINGGTTLSFNINDSAFIVTDGTNWFTLGFGSINTNIFNFQVVSLAGQSGTYNLPANLQNKVAYRFTGALAGPTNISVPATVQQYWVDNETTGFALGIGTATQIAGLTQINLIQLARYILYCDGVNVLNADTQGLSVPISILQGGTGATTANGALVNFGGTSIGIALFTAANQAAARTALGVLSDSDAVAWAIGM